MKTKSITVLFALLAGPVALLASSATDRQIEDAAKASYNYRTVLENNVKVKAKDGIVTLTGTVQDKDDKSLAADTVENLPGVNEVRNEIVVKSDHPEKSDGWIALKIRSRLLAKSNVSITNTKVNVNDGNVVLTGTADNAAQKDLTEAYVKDIDGVKTVQNEIVVREKTSDEIAAGRNMGADRNMSADRTAGADRNMGEKIDDASITSQVKYALLSHKGTSALKTKITTRDGVVIITGTAGSDAEKDLVTKLAKDVRGTRSVTNEMTVKS